MSLDLGRWLDRVGWGGYVRPLEIRSTGAVRGFFVVVGGWKTIWVG